MVVFNFWTESIIFLLVFTVIIVVPCVFVALLGKKMIDRLGQFPSQAPVIQMGVLLKLAVIEMVTFIALIIFYHIFSQV